MVRAALVAVDLGAVDLGAVCLVRAVMFDADAEVDGCDEDGWDDRCEATFAAVCAAVLRAAEGLAASCLRGTLHITPLISGVNCVLQSKVTYHWQTWGRFAWCGLLGLIWMLRLLSAMMMVGTTDAKLVRSLHSAFYSNAIALLHVIWIQSTNEYSTATIALYKLARSLLIRKLPKL
jgi:hypothetical protein